MQQVVITGSNGFIGGYLNRGLVNAGYDVYNFNRKFNSLGFSHPDVIIHCAADPNIRPTDPLTIWESNIRLTHKILELCKIVPTKPKFINMSSVAVYGPYEFVPSISNPCFPITEYGISKLASELLVQKYTRENHIEGYNLRLGGVCGPHMTHGILKKIINHYKNDSNTIEFINPAPGNDMSYLHVDYIFELVKFLIDWGNGDDTINVGSHDTMNIEKIVGYFNKKLNKNLKIDWVDKPGFVNDDSIFVSEVNTPIDMCTIEGSLDRTIKECF